MHTTKKTLNGKALFLLIILALTGYSEINAQNESSQWLFGQGAGIDFRNGTPQPIIGSKINTIEGCSTISDSKGNLLFYTDGITVWNKNHKEMPNGKNLNGSISSTQSTIIIPLPESNTIFYIFTVDSEGGKGGFCYSIADMTKEKGMGDITIKNKFINNNFTEKLVAVKQPGTTNIWIITHKYESNAFTAYLLTKNGLTTDPVVSNSGLKHRNSIYNAIGYMKVSPDKTKLALAINGDKIVQLFKFDANKGTASNPISLNFKDYSNPYGLEFSPNSNFLYISTPANGSVYQANTETDNEKILQKSLSLVGQSKNKKSLGALQLGPKGKIYIAEYESKYLSVIDKPDLAGTDCSFQLQAISLGGNICKLGLPTFVQDFVSTSTQTTSAINNAETNVRYNLSNVCFNFNKATLQNSYYPILEQLADYLNKNQKVNIQIIGHTDSIGNAEHNNNLSLERAKTIGKYLNDHGIEKSRITFLGEGSREPVTSNKSEAGRQKNRRVEFILRTL